MLKRIEDLNFSCIKDDPVRPELDMAYRLMYGREVYALEENEKIKAVICVAYTKTVPKQIEDLTSFASGMDDNIAVFYTVWSYERGAGRDIVFKTKNRIEQEKQHVNRFVTLSPLTHMAVDFHTKNGAILISENDKSYNFEYLTGESNVVTI